MNKFVRVGQIINTQGVKGQVRVWPLTKDPARFMQLKRVYLEGKVPGCPEMLTIVSSKAHKNLFLLTFEEIQDMTTAEKLKDIYLTIPMEEVPPLEEGAYYHFQLEGLKVFTEAGESLGLLRQIIETGSNDVYLVRSEDTGKEVLIPALKSVVLQVDLEKGCMTVQLPEGLLE
ncbi:16S rRNA processing protein RimM [Heliobacterium chlorum]|uniref:Ribosome maturation factor RimM n=1 Tax=Heliobacterium chlorum TaxID=2698 RepID=A0ABR7SY45_HELCL|nr:ribosome maturation factor RimM [Heliobacterium chlorum]MBC9783376.1 16S rRNA processing protein RimM [Heliobacterium chlorum]